jgi:REP element-mobilizing transposase RayT
LREYEYNRGGAYFVTMCTHERECLFGDVVDGAVRLTDMGRMVQECWDAISNHFPHCELDAFVVMPNHVHGIVAFAGDVNPVGAQHAAPDFGLSVSKAWAQHAAPLHSVLPPRTVAPGSVGAIIRSFKSTVTKRFNIRRDNPGAPVWQRRYYERIIRDDRELDGIRQYIADNPGKWAEDENHPGRV